MEKSFWIVLAVLWSCLIGGAAMGQERDDAPTALASTHVQTVRSPVVVLGSGGGTEWIGGVLATGLLFRYGRRHRAF